MELLLLNDIEELIEGMEAFLDSPLLCTECDEYDRGYVDAYEFLIEELETILLQYDEVQE